jgi:hypothetical protein
MAAAHSAADLHIVQRPKLAGGRRSPSKWGTAHNILQLCSTLLFVYMSFHM